MNLMNLSIKFLYRFIFLIQLLFLLLVYLVVLHIQETRQAIFTSEYTRYESLQIAQELGRSSDDLTNMARLYVMTGDPQYKKNYFEILGIRNGERPRPQEYPFAYWQLIVGGEKTPSSIGMPQSFTQRLEVFHFTTREKELLEIAKERSNELIKTEISAFNLVGTQRASDKERARQMLFTKEYLRAKADIMHPIQHFLDSVNERTQSEFTILSFRQKSNVGALKLIVLLNILFTLLAYYITARTLKQISALDDQVTKIGQGDYEARNTLNGNNELGILGVTMNKMCESIQKNLADNSELMGVLMREEMRFRSTVESSLIGTAIMSLDGKFLQVNDAICKMLGYTKEELLERNYQDITCEQDIAPERVYIDKLLSGEIKSFRIDKRCVKSNGKILWTIFNVATIIPGDETPQQFIIQLLDISERKENEKKMAELNQKMLVTYNEIKEHQREEILINKLSEMLQICLHSEETYPRIKLIASQLFPQMSGGLSILNPETNLFETVTVWGNDHLLQKTFSANDCYALRGSHYNIAEETNMAIPCAHYVASPKGGFMAIPLTIQMDVVIFTAVIHFYVAPGVSIDKNQQYLAMNFCNVVKVSLANIKLREILEQQSIHDALTGLYNRRFLSEVLPRELRRMSREHTTLVVAMIDIDHFKRFNDTHGHEAGDQVLEYLGNLFMQNIRVNDLACRYGGEEFVLILTGATIANATTRLNYICQLVKQAKLFHKGKAMGNVSLSIGLAIAPIQGTTEDTILRAADVALYAAKEDGRDCIVAYDPNLHTF